MAYGWSSTGWWDYWEETRSFLRESLSVEGLLNPVSNLGLDPEACGFGHGVAWLLWIQGILWPIYFSSSSGNGCGRVVYLYIGVLRVDRGQSQH